MGIKILPPDINASKENFTIENHSKSLQNLAIRFGLSAVKHVGTAAITNILETRKKNNEKFTSLTQFIQETEGRKVNKKTLEVLIQVGAMHQFGTRASMLENLDQTRDKATQFQSNVDGQDNLFADIAEQVRTLEDTFPNIPEYPKQELLSFEKKYLGLFLTEHPLADSLSAVSRQASKKISEIDLSIHNEQSFIFGGVITSLKKVRTKKNNKEMAFGNLEDETGRAEFVVFPRTFTQFSNLLAQDNVILIKAKVDDQDGELKLIVEKIIAPNQLGIRQAKINNAHEVFIPRKTNKSILEDLGKLLKKNKGDDKVVILIPNGEKPKKMLLPYGVEWSKELEKEIQGLLNN